jgi:hypothetical protein
MASAWCFHHHYTRGQSNTHRDGRLKLFGSYIRPPWQGLTCHCLLRGKQASVCERPQTSLDKGVKAFCPARDPWGMFHWPHVRQSHRCQFPFWFWRWFGEWHFAWTCTRHPTIFISLFGRWCAWKIWMHQWNEPTEFIALLTHPYLAWAWVSVGGRIILHPWSGCFDCMPHLLCTRKTVDTPAIFLRNHEALSDSAWHGCHDHSKFAVPVAFRAFGQPCDLWLNL